MVGNELGFSRAGNEERDAHTELTRKPGTMPSDDIQMWAIPVASSQKKEEE